LTDSPSGLSDRLPKSFGVVKETHEDGNIEHRISNVEHRSWLQPRYCLNTRQEGQFSDGQFIGDRYKNIEHRISNVERRSWLQPRYCLNTKSEGQFKDGQFIGIRYIRHGKNIEHRISNVERRSWLQPWHCLNTKSEGQFKDGQFIGVRYIRHEKISNTEYRMLNAEVGSSPNGAPATAWDEVLCLKRLLIQKSSKGAKASPTCC